MLQCVRLRGSQERPCRLQMHPAFQTESRGSLAKANVSAFDGVHDHSSPSDFANACSIPDSAPPGEIRVGPIEYPDRIPWKRPAALSISLEGILKGNFSIPRVSTSIEV